MGKLYSNRIALEDDGELLIDKVIRNADDKKEGLRVTADLIKQREKVRVEITEELKEGAKEDVPEKDGDGTEDDAGESESKDPEEDAPDSKIDEENDETAEEKDSDEEKDGVDSAQSSDDLEGLVGSAVKKPDSESKNDEKPSADDEEKVTKESYRLDSRYAKKLFKGVLVKHAEYRFAMEEYNLTPSKTAINQPVAYVKEEVIASLKDMIVLASRYVSKNEAQVGKAHKAISTLAESLTVYDVCHKGEKLHLTLKTVDDEAKLRAIGMSDESQLKSTSKALLKFLDKVTTTSAMILENELSSLSGSLSAGGYKEEQGLYVYDSALPGFNSVRIGMTEYRDYLHTKYEDYQVYRTTVFKVQELYDLKPISMSDDETFKTILENLLSVCIHVGVTLDNLKALSLQYAELIEKVKSTCFDIEQEKVKTLPELDIDSRLKDFIRFKLVSELLTCAIDISIEYVTSAVDSFSTLVELDN